MKWLKQPDKLWAEYGLLALVIFLPLLRLGYIQSFDMAWGPRMPDTDNSNNYWLFMEILRLLSAIIGSMLVQKLLLVGLFVLAGIGAHRLSQQTKLLRDLPMASYMAGVLYMVNPFVYTRLVAGQWLVLTGYALLPWAITSIWQLIQKPSYRTVGVALAWTTAVGLTSIHTVGFVALAAGGLLLAGGRGGLQLRLRYVMPTALAWLLLNLIWIRGFFGNGSNGLSTFGSSQLHAFMTSHSVLGSTPLTALSLQGFWADGQGRYVLPGSLGFTFAVFGLLLGIIVVCGGARVVQQRDRLGICLIALGAIAWWLGMGIGSDWSSGTTTWLVAHVPFYRGYREPQKWLMLLVLAYSYLAAVGVGSLVMRLQAVAWRPRALNGALLLPLLCTPMLLWGAGGQLVSARYPKDWATAERTLDADHADYQVLVLPWHQYLPISFAHRVVGNPAGHYFSQQLIISDNPELKGVPPTQATALYKLIDNQLLPQRNQRSDAATQLAPYRVRYVLLLKEADWQHYGWVQRQVGWRLVQDTPSLQLYRAKDAH